MGQNAPPNGKRSVSAPEIIMSVTKVCPLTPQGPGLRTSTRWLSAWCSEQEFSRFPCLETYHKPRKSDPLCPLAPIRCPIQSLREKNNGGERGDHRQRERSKKAMSTNRGSTVYSVLFFSVLE